MLPTRRRRRSWREVVVKEAGTSRQVTTNTNSDGDYVAPGLAPVMYEIFVENAGFAKAEVKNVKVDTAQVAT